MSIYNVRPSFMNRYYLYISKRVYHSLFTAHCIGKPLPKTSSLHSIISSAQSYPLQNYISREEFTFIDHYLNRLTNSLINYFYLFQNSQNTIASFMLGFLSTIHSLFSFTDTPLYTEEIHCSLQLYPKTRSR